MEKLRTESVDVRVSNADDKERRYDIAATAHIEGGKIAYIHYGEARALPGEDGEAGAPLVTFDTWNGGNLNVQFQGAADKGGVLSEVDGFVTLMLADGAVVSPVNI